MKITSLLISVFSIGLAISAGSCRRQQSPQAETQPGSENYEADSLVFSGYTIHLVRLTAPVEKETTEGETKRYTQAWLVKFDIGKFARESAEPIEFYIDDYRIPEYGGWERGIYFRIYEEQLLNKLNSGEIRYRMPSHNEIVSTGTRLELPANLKMQVEDEERVLK